jgi:DNA (cytosine-5)-methyltransferase 1
MRPKIKAISLFSGAGIGEMYLNDLGIEIVAANEIISKRADLYSFFYPKCFMITGDIKDKKIKDKIKSFAKEDVRLLIATPPCQGVSSIGKNKLQSHFEKDYRNYLIFDIFDIINSGNFDYILIENVPRFLKMYFPYNDKYRKLTDILNDLFGDRYLIESDILNAKEYGVPQSRPRAIIKLFKRNLKWPWPKKKSEISLAEAIGHLPSLEPGENSNIPWHYAKKLPTRIALALSHTPPGKSALRNEVYYPKKENGDRILGFHNTYKRMVWNQPAHARTTYCGSISSHNNVHPGRKRKNGTYTDARVLTILETLIVSSLPENLEFPEWANDTFIRTVIGEAIPPIMLKEIMAPIFIGRENDL